MDLLSPLQDPVEFARLTAVNVILWGVPFFLFEVFFEAYTARLEKWGYLERHAPHPSLPRGAMLRQSAVAIAGVALPGCLALAVLRPTWTYDVSVFGAVAMVPFVFAHALVFDTWFYWAHRLAHSVPWLYRVVHKLHHAPQASLTSGSSAYMSFAEGALMVGVPFVPIVLCAVCWLGANVWTLAAPVYTIVSAVSLGHVGANVKRSWLPILAISPYMVAMAITHASRPEDHSAHHERVVVNFATLFRFWDDWCGTAPAPGLPSTRGWGVVQAKKGEGAGGGKQQPPPKRQGVRAKDVPIGLRVSLYNACNSFAFLGVLLLATGAPAFFAAALALALALPASLRFEAACFRALGLTRLVTRHGFWDGLRRDLRVSVEREEGVSSPSWSSSSSSSLASAGEEEGDEAPVVVRRTSPRLLEKRAALEAAVADSLAQRCEEEQERQQRPSSLSPPSTPQPSARRAAPRARGGSPTTTHTAAAAAAAADARLAPQAPKLYVYHPRGDLMRGAFFAFGPRGRDPAHPLAAERDVRLALPPAAARVLLRLPLVRELVALLGGVHPASVAAALKAGASVAVCLPGPPVRGPPRRPVAADAAPAFIDAALASGAALVPVVAVGEAELAGRLPLRDKIVMPLRPGCAVRVVVGAPIVAGPDESAQRLRARFAAELAALAARHGAPPPEPADV
jgi:sterol desaturase/sphingolipid hydroxylase (fatty acid hydroxylase superfamily)